MVIKFNSLVNKQQCIAITKDIKKGFNQLKGIKFPQSAVEYDVVELANTKFPNECSSQIYTFKNKKGTVLQQNIITKDSEDIYTIQRNFKKMPDSCVINPENPDDLDCLDTFGRKISTITKKNGKYYGKSEMIQSCTLKHDGENVVNISKIESFPIGIERTELESQSMYEYTKNGKRGYQINQYVRSQDMGLEFDNDETAFVFENMINLKQDEYLPLQVYPFKHFKKIAPLVARHPEHNIMPIYSVKWFFEKPVNKRVRNGFFDGIDINLNKFTVNNRFSVVQTSAHEKEHLYQKLQSDYYKTAEGEKYKKARTNYVSSDENFAEYQKNYMEVKAREAGRLAKNAYVDSAEGLREQFQYAPNYQIGYSHLDEDRCNTGIFDIFDRINVDVLDIEKLLKAVINKKS